jgi:hypothetical protein
MYYQPTRRHIQQENNIDVIGQSFYKTGNAQDFFLSPTDNKIKAFMCDVKDVLFIYLFICFNLAMLLVAHYV